MSSRFALLAIALAAPAVAAPGGPIGTMQRGHYMCELPGDATGAAGIRMQDSDFIITNASSYAAGELAGSYLLTGDRLTMTSGPMQGQQFLKISANFVRMLMPDGSESALRCVRRVTNNRLR